MSVVNQMLRDLDRRQAGEENAVYTQHLRPVDARRRAPLLLIGAAFLIAAGGTYAALQYFNRLAPAAPLAETAAPPVGAPIKAPSATQLVPAAEMPQADSNAFTTDEVQANRRSSETGNRPISTAVTAQSLPAAEPAPPRAHDSSESANSDSAPADSRTPMRAIEDTPALASRSAPVQTTRIVAGDRSTEADAATTKIDVRPHAQPAPDAESEFRRAAALINQARNQEARAALKKALELDARHEGARQTLAVLLIEARAMSEAEALLTEGLKLNPNQSNFAIVLARLKLDHNDDAGALQVLREHGAAAVNNAEYRAFAGALLQRMNRHPEALDEYRAALTVSPNVGVWWVGLALSFEATGEPDKAAEAFMRARTTGTLSADVAQFVEGKLQTMH